MHRLLAVVLCTLCLLPACTPEAPPADAVLLGRLFDSRQGQVLEEGVVVLGEGRILCAGTPDDCRWPAGTPVHDYGQATLLPGLIDLHVHARPHYVRAFLPSGITTVRDANNTLATIDTLRSTPGAPRILASGPALDGPGSVLAGEPSPLGSQPLESLMPITVTSAEDAAAAVLALHDAGTEWIKLYEQIPHDAFQSAVQTANEAGIPVMADLGLMLTRGLAGAEVDAVQAGTAGISTLEHLSGAALAYQRLGGDPLAGSLDDALLDQLAQAIAATGMAVVPTAGTARQFHEPHALGLDDLPGAARVAPHFTGFWQHLEGVLAGEGPQSRSAADLRLASALLPRLQAAGVAIGAGSDVPAAPRMLPGAALHQELDALVQAGLTPAQALQSATHTAASILGADELGRIEAGASADILVVDGDPLTNILHTRRVRAVWFQGTAVDVDAAWDEVERTLQDAARESGA